MTDMQQFIDELAELFRRYKVETTIMPNQGYADLHINNRSVRELEAGVDHTGRYWCGVRFNGEEQPVSRSLEVLP